MNSLAIKQGRLSAPQGDNPNAFPWDNWRAEFDTARQLGLQGIEWMLASDRVLENPILVPDGRRMIRETINLTGVTVPSVCADYFMEHPFFRTNDERRRRSIAMLQELVPAAAELGVGTILIPVLEAAAVRNDDERDMLLDALEEPLVTAARSGIKLGLEAELPADRYCKLVTVRPHPQLGIYYDVGNAVSCGFDPTADLERLAPYLVGVHLKDRKRGGPSVPFGEGDVDFAAVLATIDRIGHQSPLVLEPKSGIDFVGLALRNVDFVRANLKAAA